jgi:UDP-glucose 4-epimerase
MKVLVTGASGELGKYMVHELEEGYELVLFSRTQPPEELASHHWIQGDLNSFEDCQRAVERVQAIQHLGAMSWPTDHPAERQFAESMGWRVPPFDMTMRTNIMGTYYLMQAAVQAGVNTVVMTGSNCALGHGYRLSDTPFPFHYLPLDEAHPSEVEDSYSYSKLAGEELLASFTRAHGIRTYLTRPAEICPPQRRKAMADNAQPATGWDDWLWGWVPSEDVAWVQRALMEKAQELPLHDVYLLNGADTTALEETVDLVAKYRPDLLPLAEGLKGHQAFFSTEKARGALGFEARYTWREYL